MGLDMYLEARKYVSRFVSDYYTSNSDLEPQKSEQYKELEKFFPEGSDELGDHAGAEVKITVGYWRKANAIHGWFVNECAGGVDECQPIYADAMKLRELRATIETLLDNKEKPEMARKLLSPTAGFFFGSYDIDEFYWEDLQKSVEILNKAINLAEKDGCSIIYQASW